MRVLSRITGSTMTCSFTSDSCLTLEARLNIRRHKIVVYFQNNGQEALK
jgi:hypothetical protein